MMNATQKQMTEMVKWVTDYECTEKQAQYLEYRYTLNQLKDILGKIELEWGDRNERAFLGELNRH